MRIFECRHLHRIKSRFTSAELSDEAVELLVTPLWFTSARSIFYEYISVFECFSTSSFNLKINETKFKRQENSEHEDCSAHIRRLLISFLLVLDEARESVYFYVLARLSSAVIKIDTSPVSALISLFSRCLTFERHATDIFPTRRPIIRIFAVCAPAKQKR